MKLLAIFVGTICVLGTIAGIFGSGVADVIALVLLAFCAAALWSTDEWPRRP